MYSEILFNDASEVCRAVDLRPLDGATVLITGATGMLGINLLASLCLARESGIRNTTFAHCHSTPSAHTLEIAKRGGIQLVREMPLGADIIVHASGYAQPAVFTANPAETIRINTSLTQDLLDLLRRDGKFLFISSSEVYNGLQKPFAQESDIGTTNPYHTRACYIEGKRCGEAICNSYRKFEVNATSARLSLAYGPGTRKHDKRALSTFIEKALTSGVIDMKYSGKELRTFCYVRDAVIMLWRVLLYGTEPVYNVGGHLAVSMAEMAECVSRLTGAKVTFPEIEEELKGAPEVSRMDLSLIENEFGAVDYVGLEEGLKSTIDWQRGLYGTVQN